MTIPIGERGEPSSMDTDTATDDGQDFFSRWWLENWRAARLGSWDF
jgi:hypothetical protein